MKHARTLRFALLVLIFAHPVESRAILGVGDVVFDPENTAQTINVLLQTEQEVQRLGTLLGVSTQQLTALLQVGAAIGNATEATSFSQPLTPLQLQASVGSIPGLQGSSLSALFNTNGQLDVFMGVPLSAWTQSVQTPNDYYRTILVNPAIERVGGSVGMNAPEVAYTQWYAARTPEDQYNLQVPASVDLASLLTNGWLETAQQRRVNLQALAAANQDAQTKGAQSQTLSDQQHAQSQASTTTNSILLETAAQNAGANEAVVRAAHAQVELLSDENEARRNADAVRLNLPQ
jgi:hypothetical protein